MALIVLEQQTDFIGSQQDNFGNYKYNFRLIDWVFNTDTKEVQYSEQIVEVNDDREYTAGQTYLIDPAVDFYSYTTDTGAIRHYTYVGNGNLDIWDTAPTDEQNPCTLAITSVTVRPVSYAGTNDGEATINAINTQGFAVQYSLDNVNWQTSPFFSGLGEAAYKAYIQDSRTPTPCRAEFEFTVTKETEAPACDLQILEVSITPGKGIFSIITATATTSAAPISYELEEIASGLKYPSTTGVWDVYLPGAYKVSAKDYNRCETNQVIAIAQAIPEAIDFSRNPILYQVPASAPGAEVEFSIYVEFSHYQNDFQKIITRRQKALKNSVCTFQLDSILHTLLNRNFDLPDIINRPNKICSQGILNYYLTYAEINSETGLPGEETKTPLRTVLKGGLPPEQLGQLNYFQNYLIETKGFLSWLPAITTIGPDQPEFIYYLNQNPTTEIKVIREFAIANGQSTVADTIHIPENAYRYRLLCLPVSHGPLSDSIKSVTITLQDDSGKAISEPRVYKLDKSYYRYQRYFLYENSFGGFQTLRTTGPAEISLDGKDELAESPAAYPGLIQKNIYSQTIDKKIRQSSGLKTPEEHERLQEFIYSASRYESIRERLVPIILSKKGYTYDPESRRPTGYLFEYDYAFEAISYSKLK